MIKLGAGLSQILLQFRNGSAGISQFFLQKQVILFFSIEANLFRTVMITLQTL
jgi:hypothetical protein